MNPQLRSLLLLILLPLAARADDAVQSQLAPRVSAAIDELADAEMAKQGIVGLAVGVVQDGKIALVRGYGWADREAKTAVTRETVFN